MNAATVFAPVTRLCAEQSRRLPDPAGVRDDHLDAPPQRIRNGQNVAAAMHASAWARSVLRPPGLKTPTVRETLQAIRHRDKSIFQKQKAPITRPGLFNVQANGAAGVYYFR